MSSTKKTDTIRNRAYAYPTWRHALPHSLVRQMPAAGDSANGFATVWPQPNRHRVSPLYGKGTCIHIPTPYSASIGGTWWRSVVIPWHPSFADSASGASNWSAGWHFPPGRERHHFQVPSLFIPFGSGIIMSLQGTLCCVATSQNHLLFILS